MNIDNIAKKLCELSLSASYDEKLVQKFEDNIHYKVCYRFLSNMLSEWKELGFDHFPSEIEAIDVAKISHPYFVWAFRDLSKLDEFKRLYDFHQDTWKYKE